MSADDNDDKPGKERRSSKSNGTQTTGENITSHGIGEIEPVPTNLDFYEWLESLFDGSNQFPELIQWQVVEGKKHDRPGPVINKVVYRPKSPKPSREELVKLSNKIIADCQYDCSVQRRGEVMYQVAALHFAKSSDYYSRKLLRFEPRLLGSGHPAPRDSDDEEVSAEKLFSVQIMRHQENMVPQAIDAYSGVLQHMERLLNQAYARIKELEERCNKQADMIERAQSLSEEREGKRRWRDLTISSIEKTRDVVLPMLPPMASQIFGKPPAPGQTQSLEALTLANFINTLKEEQAEMILGRWDNEQCTLPGILDRDQAELFIRVAMCQLPIDRIDELLPGGAHAVSDEQMLRIMQCGIPLGQLASLRILLEGRMKKKMAAPPSDQQATT